jgi:hypothetical protein
MLRNIYRYGKVEDIMEKIDHARKGRINEYKKERLHLFVYKQNKKLIDEQRTNEGTHKHILFDVAMEYEYIDTPRNIAHRTHTITDSLDLGISVHHSTPCTPLRPRPHKQRPTGKHFHNYPSLI